METIWESERCAYCGGTIVDTRVDLHRKIKGEYVLIEDIPAGTCTSCGARFYTTSVLKPIEEIIRGHLGTPRAVRVPVYSLLPFEHMLFEEPVSEETPSSN